MRSDKKPGREESTKRPDSGGGSRFIHEGTSRKERGRRWIESVVAMMGLARKGDLTGGRARRRSAAIVLAKRFLASPTAKRPREDAALYWRGKKKKCNATLRKKWTDRAQIEQERRVAAIPNSRAAAQSPGRGATHSRRKGADKKGRQSVRRNPPYRGKRRTKGRSRQKRRRGGRSQNTHCAGSPKLNAAAHESLKKGRG